MGEKNEIIPVYRNKAQKEKQGQFNKKKKRNKGMVFSQENITSASM